MVNLFTNKTFQNIKIFLQNVTLQIGQKKKKQLKITQKLMKLKIK